MNSTQIKDLVGTLIGIVAGFAVAKGWGDSDLWTAIGAGGSVVGAALWAYWAHKSAPASVAK